MKCISPLIATVIIVSVVIALSIAFALWIISVTPTDIEKLEITGTYITIIIDKFSGRRVYQLKILVRNTGTVDATIDNIFLNNQPLSSYGNDVNITNIELPYLLKKGESIEICLNLTYTRFFHGQMVEVAVHTASGRWYPVIANIP